MPLLCREKNMNVLYYNSALERAAADRYQSNQTRCAGKQTTGPWYLKRLNQQHHSHALSGSSFSLPLLKTADSLIILSTAIVLIMCAVLMSTSNSQTAGNSHLHPDIFKVNIGFHIVQYPTLDYSKRCTFYSMAHVFVEYQLDLAGQYLAALQRMSEDHSCANIHHN